MSKMVGRWISFWEGEGDDRFRTEGVVIEVHAAGFLLDDWTDVIVSDVGEALGWLEITDETELQFICWARIESVILCSVRKGLERLQKKRAYEEKEREKATKTTKTALQS